jgi:DNA-binding FadR family transcriptional regulator
MSEPVTERSGPTFEPLRPLQRYEHVAERLAAEIRSGAFAPGERLPSERELSRRLEVGRASVREAIAALQVQGVIETRPGSGSFVAPDARERLPTGLTHDASPTDVLEARALFEPEVARLAAQRGRPDPECERLLDAMEASSDPADPAARAGWNESDRLFHRQIAALTGNPVLAGIAGHIASLMDQPLWQRLRDDSIATPGRTAIHLAEHRMIYEAIAEGDPDAAASYAAGHVKRVRRYMTLD